MYVPLLSSIGVNKNAKRVSIIHISFNLFGTAIGLVVYCIARYAVDLALFNDSITPVMIAVFHSIFNVATQTGLIGYVQNKMLGEITEEAKAVPDGRPLPKYTNIAMDEMVVMGWHQVFSESGYSQLDDIISTHSYGKSIRKIICY